MKGEEVGVEEGEEGTGGDGSGGGGEADEVGEAADEGGGGVEGAQMAHFEGAVAFAEAAALGVGEEWDVAVAGWLEAEEGEEVDLLGGAEEEVVAADDLCHSHEGVVGDYGELVGPGTVGTPQDEVAAVAGEVY